MYKEVIVGKEPEKCRIFCSCGIKYRSEPYWFYIENGSDVSSELRHKAEYLFSMSGFPTTLQKNKYICPYCNVKQKILDTPVCYTMDQLILFSDMIGADIDASLNKDDFLLKLKEHFES